MSNRSKREREIIQQALQEQEEEDEDIRAFIRDVFLEDQTDDEWAYLQGLTKDYPSGS